MLMVASVHIIMVAIVIFWGAVTAQIRLHIQLVSFWMDQKQCLK